MQIEEGKYYRTRDGRKCGPMIGPDWSGMFRAEGYYQKTSTPDAPQWWCEDGSVVQMGPGEENDQLVAEWSETGRSAGLIISEIEERLIEMRSLLS